MKLFVLLFILAVTVGKTSAQDTIGHISGTVRVQLKNDKISAKLKYKYIAFEENEPLLKLYLNKNFTVGKVKCKVCKSFEFDQKSERLPVLKIQISRPKNSAAFGKPNSREIFNKSWGGVFDDKEVF